MAVKNPFVRTRRVAWSCWLRSAARRFGVVLALACVSPCVLCAADDVRKVTVVLKRPPRSAHSEKKVLVREIVRQGFLLAAREEFRALTRDEVLGEPAVYFGDAGGVFDMAVEVPEDGAVKIELRGGKKGGAAAPWNATFQATGEQLLVLALEKSDGWSQADFPKFLRDAGLAVPTAAVPDVELLPTDPVPLEAIAQVAHLRRLHAHLLKEPKSPALLAAAARHYALLGSLCDRDWGLEHKALKARALLYAERAVRNGPQDAGAAWSRALVRALCGLNFLALPEIERARTLGTPKEAPPWAEGVAAFARWDEPALAKGIEQEQPLAAYLGMLAREMIGTESQRIEAYQRALEADPSCLRAALGASLEKALVVRRRFGESQLPLFASQLPELVKQLEPTQSGGKVAPPAARPDQMLAASAEQVSGLRKRPDDRGEPSLYVAATLIENLQFAQAVQLLDTERRSLGVDTEETVKQLNQLLPDHPMKGFFRLYQRDSRGAQRALREISGGMVAQGLSEGALPSVSWFEWLRADREYQDLMQSIRRQRDDVVPELLARLSDSLPEAEHLGALGVLRRMSPDCPAVIAATVQRDWKSAEPQAEGWEKGTSNPRVLMALADQYRAQRKAEAEERCLLRWSEIDLSHEVYGRLADLYLRTDREERWKEIVTESLEIPGFGLEQAQANNQLARWHMRRSEWREALPYAEAAAESYSSWGLGCAQDCYEALGGWEQSEAVARARTGRYQGDWLEWYLWCRRNGRGDLAGARTAAQAGYDELAQRGFKLELEQAVFNELEGRLPEALEIYLHQYRSKQNNYAGMCAVIVLDELDRSAERDHLIREMCSVASQSEFAVLCDQLRRLPGAPAPGLTAAELDLVQCFDVGDGHPTNVACFIGQLLQRRDRQADAEIWLKRAASSPLRNKFCCTKAAAALVRAKADLPRVRGSELEAAYGAARKLFQRAQSLRDESDSEGALKACREGIAAAPDWLHGRMISASFNADLGRPEQGLEDFNRLLELVPGQPYLLSRRGKVRESLKDDRGAIADYEAALASSPAFKTAHNNLGWLRAAATEPELRNGDLAVRHAKKAFEAGFEQDANGLALLAAAYAEKGDFDEAIRLIDSPLAGKYSDVTRLQNWRDSYRQKKPYRRSSNAPFP